MGLQASNDRCICKVIKANFLEGSYVSDMTKLVFSQFQVLRSPIDFHNSLLPSKCTGTVVAQWLKTM